MNTVIINDKKYKINGHVDSEITQRTCYCDPTKIITNFFICVYIDENIKKDIERWQNNKKNIIQYDKEYFPYPKMKLNRYKIYDQFIAIEWEGYKEKFYNGDD